MLRTNYHNSLSIFFTVTVTFELRTIEDSFEILKTIASQTNREFTWRRHHLQCISIKDSTQKNLKKCQLILLVK